MKLITNLTEEEAVAVAAAVVTFRAVRGAIIERVKNVPDIYRSWRVVVETYSAEESVINVKLG